MKVADTYVADARMQLINTVSMVADGAARTVTPFRLERDYGVSLGETVLAARANEVKFRALDGAELAGTAEEVMIQRIDSYDELDKINVYLTAKGRALAGAAVNVAVMTLWKAERQRCRLDLLCATAKRDGVLAALAQKLAWAFPTQTVDLGGGVDLRTNGAIEPDALASWLQRRPREVGTRVVVRLTRDGRQHVPMI